MKKFFIILLLLIFHISIQNTYAIKPEEKIIKIYNKIKESGIQGFNKTKKFIKNLIEAYSYNSTKKNDFKYQDYSEHNLNGENLSFLDLSGCSFENSSLVNSNLINISGSNLNFYRADLTDANLFFNKNFLYQLKEITTEAFGINKNKITPFRILYNFNEAKLINTNITNTINIYSNFNYAELIGTKMYNCLFIGCSFKHALFDAIDLSNTTWVDVDLRKANLQYIKKAQNADFSFAILTNEQEEYLKSLGAKTPRMIKENNATPNELVKADS